MPKQRPEADENVFTRRSEPKNPWLLHPDCHGKLERTARKYLGERILDN